PYSQRFHPPEPVIKAFESYGFVWGGKWSSYDTMHFEYRPEIFILNNLPLTTFR
ncbi:MAG: M15 family metallopeptidase, partial [Treponema sp.]|nr:M15 family metallopeptidase [Treponema sp.]